MIYEIIDYVEKFCYDETLIEKLEEEKKFQEKLIKQINYIKNHKRWVINDEFLHNLDDIK